MAKSLEKFLKACKVVLYGRSVLDGYYSPPQSLEEEKKNKPKKDYVYASVFPNSKSMEKALSQNANKIK